MCEHVLQTNGEVDANIENSSPSEEWIVANHRHSPMACGAKHSTTSATSTAACDGSLLGNRTRRTEGDAEGRVKEDVSHDVQATVYPTA